MSDPGSSGVAPSLWRPLRTKIFRNLLLADVISDVGTFMQSVGAAWLMVSLKAGPLYVALTQTASSLPFFLLALPAGSIGDIVDRRKLILFTEIWMASIAIVLAVTTVGGFITPALLLILTFALSAGDAFESPTWRAILPELVPKEDLSSASALNGIEFNFARAVGPALAGLVVATVGAGFAFGINAVSFLGVIYVVARWKRTPRVSTSPRETLTGATVAAIRFVRYSPRLRGLLARSGSTMFFASALLALLPSLAHTVNPSPLFYGVLLGSFGVGAVLGALAIQRVRSRWSTDRVVSVGVLAMGLSMLAAGIVPNIPALTVSMMIAGAAWIVFISTFNVVILNHTPDWVRARVLAVTLLVSQGAMAGGSALWGALADKFGIHPILMWAGVGAIAIDAVGLLLFKLPDAAEDLTPWIYGKLPAIVSGEEPGAIDSSRVLVTVEYEVAAEHQEPFLHAMQEYERVRRRDGAYRWGIFRDLENATRFLETFLVDSWAEHVRQHQRSTGADREIAARVQKFVLGAPRVRHHVQPLFPERPANG
ncbi:MAG TPA: MFS transporter [Candidatus Angelobacter sp.]|nr:MFS transporter [Candidatus Angelobacter sp.]